VNPRHFQNSEGPHQDESVTFRIILKRQNLDKLEQLFWDVNTPSSSKYGEFLTQEQIDQLIAPSEESVKRVLNWINQFQIQNLRIQPDFFEVSCQVRTAQKMFSTKIIPFVQAGKSSRTLFRIFGEASIPKSLENDIELISGISELFSDKTKYSSSTPDHSSPETTINSVLNARAKEPTRVSKKLQDDILVTPSVIRSYYQIPAGQKSSNPANFQGIAAFDDYYSAGALQSFCTDQGLPTPNVTRTGPICWPHQCDQYESDLDIQYITSIGLNTPTQFINHDQGNWILGWAQELHAMSNPAFVHSVSYGWSELNQCELTKKCATLGYNSMQYVAATNIELQKLGARGLSILVSDGDDGAASLGRATGNCPMDPSVYCIGGGCGHTYTKCAEITISANGFKCFWPMGSGSLACAQLLNDTGVNALQDFFNANAQCNVNVEKDQRGNLYFFSDCACSALSPSSSYGYTVTGYTYDQNNGALFIADYPTSSPYVTSVGATQFISSGGSIQKEVACSVKTGGIITTGGGFSSFQQQPSYQSAAVRDFLSSGTPLPPSYSYNTAMRAYPDITLVGHNYKIFASTNTASPDQCPCQSTSVDGTSASSPTVAAFFSLINDQLLTKGATPLGFLNPTLYQIYQSGSYSAVFNDVVEGDNFCTRSYCCLFGWTAGKGWDPVSGLGSPNWAALSNYILNTKLNKKNGKIGLN